jgi:hypothetical protein
MSHALADSQNFFETPTLVAYQNLQRLAFESPGYDPRVRQLLEIESQVAEASPAHSLNALSRLPAYLQICPRFHYVTARVREILGETDEMRASIQKLRTCLQSIMESGEGTRRSPFCIAFLTDQDDVLMSVGEQKRYQQSATGAKCQFDVVTAHSGVEFWFDVTEISRKQSSKVSKAASY